MICESEKNALTLHKIKETTHICATNGFNKQIKE